jgi:hypothetical protein
MPYKNPEDRKRTPAAKAYGKRPEVLAANRARNKARYEAMKEGKVAKGDGMDIDHIKPLRKGASKNRSFDRNSDHSVRKNSPKK